MPCTVNGGEAAVVRVDPRAHLAQRRGDAVDGPAADRLVAVERPLAAGLAREPAGREPHQRARVADVDVRLGGRAQPGPADRQRARSAPSSTSAPSARTALSVECVSAASR